MKFENTRAMNFESAFHGMRNPKESWHKSDSIFGLMPYSWEDNAQMGVVEEWVRYENYYDKEFDIYNNEAYNHDYEKTAEWLRKNGVLHHDADVYEFAYLGPNDMKLAQTLIKGGSEHRKFLRQIFVSVDITAPLFWWKEADTYKVGTTANSTSTMHKLTSKPITLDCFEIENYPLKPTENEEEVKEFMSRLEESRQKLIDWLEELRQKYLETKDKRYWKELVRWLPESWLQTRTFTMNYENILTICKQRKGHKLTEWKSFIDWAHTLPYAEELLFFNNNKSEDC